MKFFSRVLLAAALMLLPYGMVDAGILVLSGDSNITNPLDGSGGAGGIDPGNGVFFTNVLGGGTSVSMHGDLTVNNDGFDALNDHYNSLGGVTSTVFNGAITAGQLAGSDLFISFLPNDAFTGAELTAMGDFYNGGGSIMFFGEHEGFSDENDRINAALGALGSSMSIISNTFFDSGYHTATTGNGQIEADPLTAGVTTFTYAAPSEAMVAGGTTLFTGTAPEFDPFVAYESNNGGPVIPEPGTLIIWTVFAGTGLVCGSRRKRA